MELLQNVISAIKNELLSHANNMVSEYTANNNPENITRANAGKLSLAQTMLTFVANIEKQIFNPAPAATTTADGTPVAAATDDVGAVN